MLLLCLLLGRLFVSDLYCCKCFTHDVNDVSNSDVSLEGKNNTESTKNNNITMSFNISEIRQSVGDHHKLTSAELRMLIKKTTIQGEQRAELYYGLGAAARYLATRFISNQMKDKWLSFDVTEPLQKWLQGSGKMTPPIFCSRKPECRCCECLHRQ